MSRDFLRARLRSVGSAAAIAAALLAESAAAKTSVHVQPLIQTAAAVIETDRKSGTTKTLVLQAAKQMEHQFTGHRSHSSHKSHSSHSSHYSSSPGSSAGRIASTPSYSAGSTAPASTRKRVNPPRRSTSPSRSGGVVTAEQDEHTNIQPLIANDSKVHPSPSSVPATNPVSLPKWEVESNTPEGPVELIRIRLDDEPGTRRPSTSDLRRIAGQLNLKDTAKLEFLWTRGRYKTKPWAIGTFDARHETYVQIMQDVIDYDIIDSHASATRVYMNVSMHTVKTLFPSKEEILGIFDELKVNGNCRIDFFFAGDAVRKHKAVSVSRLGIESPKVALYPKSGAREH